MQILILIRSTSNMVGWPLLRRDKLLELDHVINARSTGTDHHSNGSPGRPGFGLSCLVVFSFRFSVADLVMFLFSQSNSFFHT